MSEPTITDYMLRVNECVTHTGKVDSAQRELERRFDELASAVLELETRLKTTEEELVGLARLILHGDAALS